MKTKTRRYGLMGIAALLVCAATVGAYLADSAIYSPPNYNGFIPPAAGGTYVDPVFGTTVQRLSDANAMGAQFIETEYSTASPFSIDNSWTILLHFGQFGLYTGQGNFIRMVTNEVCATCEPRWSRKDPNVFYYHTGNNLKTYDASTGATAVIHTFSEYSSIDGKGEMDISFDGDHLVFAGNGRYVFVYTISTGAKGPVLDTGGRAFDSLYITPDNRITVTWNGSTGSSRYQGVELFDTNMNFVRQLTHAGGHMHMSQDVNGDPVLIWTNSNDPAPACGQNAIVKVNVNTGAQTCLLSLDWNLAVHISAADSTWAFVETYAPSNPAPGSSGWHAYTNELLQIKLDGTEARRLVHHRSRPFDSYVYEPKLTASHDASRLAYSSNMNMQAISGYNSIYADSYLIQTGTTVPAGVSGGGGTTTVPANTAPPVISGSALQGSTLASSNGTWSGSPTSYAYQWQRCGSTGANCNNISGANGQSYTLSSSDVGSTLCVKVTASNSAGSASATSAYTAVVQAPVASVPVNTAPPAISGTAQQGATLTGTTGTWSNSPTAYTFQWQRCGSTGCAAISGANSQTYLLGAADVGSTMRLAVTALNAAGSATANSAQTAVVQASSTPPPPTNGIALAQSASALGTGVASLAKAFPAATTAGNMIIAFVRMSGTSQTVSVTDSAGNTYAKAVSQAQTTDGHQAYIFYAANIKGGADTVTATFSGTNNHPWLAVYEYSGLSGLDKIAASQGSGTAVSSAAITTTSANELVFAAVGLPASWTGQMTPGAGYALLQQSTSSSPGGNEGMAVSATGTYSGTFTLSASANWSVVVATFAAAGTTPNPTITTTSLPAGTVSAAYSATLADSGATDPCTWSITSGTLPAGLTLAASTGVIAGTPTTAGTNSFTVQMQDANAKTATKALSITINAPAPLPISITTTSLPAGTVSAAYSATLADSGATDPCTWSITSGTLPAGLTLAAGTGVIAGTPTTAGTSSFTVQIKDANAQTASKALGITINAPAATAPIALVQSKAGQGTGVASLSQAFAAGNTAGNMIIAFVRMSTTSQTVKVTDSAGDTYALAVSQAQTTDGHQTYIFYASNIKGGANTVTATFSGANNHPWLAVYEYRGVSALDRTARAQGSNSAPNSGLTAATSAARELVFGGLGLPSSSAVTVATASGYAMEQQNTIAPGSRAATEDGTASATGAFAGAFSLSGAANWACIVATFK